MKVASPPREGDATGKCDELATDGLGDQSLRDRQLHMGALALAKHEDRHGSIVDEHLQIIEAISRGDVEAATQIVRVHIGRTRDALDARD